MRPRALPGLALPGLVLPGLVLVLAAVWAGGCGNDSAPTRDVPDLDVPTDGGIAVAVELRRAERLIAAGADEEAEPVLRDVVARDPDRVEAWTLLGTVLVEARRYVDAVPVLERSLQLDAADLVARRRLAECHHLLGDLPAAEAAYQAWAQRDERNEDALYGLGQVLYLRGDAAGAVKTLRKAERRRGGRADIRSELGLALQSLGKLEESEAKQRDALERDPTYAIAWFRLGNVIAEQDPTRLDDAIGAMERATQEAPRMIHAHLYLYRLLKLAEQAGNVTAAEAAETRWATVLRLHGRKQLARVGLGGRRVPSGTAAERRLRRVLEADPADALSRAKLARLLHGERRLDEALEQYDVLLDTDTPDAAVIADAGTARLVDGDLDAALELLQNAVARDPSLPGAARLLGWALLRADRVDDAEIALGKALEARPDDRLASLALGLAWMRDRRLDAGLHAIARAGWLE